MATTEEQIEQGIGALSRGEIDQAISDLTAVVSENPEKWTAWRGLGQAYHQKGDYQKAIEAFAKATVIRPDDVESHYGHGLAYQAIDDHAHAIRAFEEALYRDHQHRPSQQAVVQSLMTRAKYMRDIRNLLAVEEYLEKAHKFDPTNIEITAELLGYYAETDQAFKADSLKKELMSHGLPVPEAHTHEEVDTRVELTADMGTDAIRAALANDQENWKGWRALGDAELAAGNFQVACEAYKKATVIRFDDADSQYGYGLALQKMGDHGHAIPPFEEAIAHDPNHHAAKEALAVSLLARVDEMERIGNLLAVEQYLEKAYKIHPENEGVRDKLVTYYNQTGQAGKANAIRGVVETAPSPETAGSVSSGDDVLLAAERYYEEPEPVATTAPQAQIPPSSATHDPLLSTAPGHTPPPAQASIQQTQMLPCPACKQLMPSIARICVHCSARVDPIQGIRIGADPGTMALSPGEKVYKVVSWLRLAYGLLLIAAAALVLLAPAPTAQGPDAVSAESIKILGMTLGIVGTVNTLFALGLLFEIDWAQFLIYWGSFIALLAGLVTFFFNGVFIANPIGMIEGILSIGINGTTMWAIKQVADV
ncbi:tetratricopeptide repeat protein [Kamptonema cortianum]|nr:tetratricopeptide repeat protein [Geitlerinema splendidum]MDK3162240.1 tetratricopeptide repeat protein [Kamptonema cortianum]